MSDREPISSLDCCPKLASFALSILLLFTARISRGQTFQDFVNRVSAAPEMQRAALVDSFMGALPSFPFIEQDSTVHFLYRGGASRVNVPGDANVWDPNAFPMTKLSTTDLWYRTERFEPDARLDYKFVLNGSTWILDPRNPRQGVGGFGPNSELRMPAYVPAPEIEFYPNRAHGTLQDTTFYSTNLSHSRRIRIYIPPLYESSSARYPVILFQDGLEYLSLAQANHIIDYLIAQNRIEPVLAVFVPPVNRTSEYAGSQMNSFMAFIVNELLPYVDRRYRTRTDPASRALMGASHGGNISLWIGYNHPEVFGNIAAQSSNIQSVTATSFQDSPRLNLKLYLDLGTYDIPQLIPLVRNFIPILQAKSYEYRYIEYHEGHSWGNWRAHIDNALEMFFPGSALQVREQPTQPKGSRLMPNYPNPFNLGTRIGYALSRSGSVKIFIYNLRGQLVRTLVDHLGTLGDHSVVWDGRDNGGQAGPSGIYLCRLQIGERTVDPQRILLLR